MPSLASRARTSAARRPSSNRTKATSHCSFGVAAAAPVPAAAVGAALEPVEPGTTSGTKRSALRPLCRAGFGPSFASSRAGSARRRVVGPASGRARSERSVSRSSRMVCGQRVERVSEGDGEREQEVEGRRATHRGPDARNDVPDSPHPALVALRCRTCTRTRTEPTRHRREPLAVDALARRPQALRARPAALGAGLVGRRARTCAGAGARGGRGRRRGGAQLEAAGARVDVRCEGLARRGGGGGCGRCRGREVGGGRGQERDPHVRHAQRALVVLFLDVLLVLLVVVCAPAVLEHDPHARLARLAHDLAEPPHRLARVARRDAPQEGLDVEIGGEGEVDVESEGGGEGGGGRGGEGGGREPGDGKRGRDACGG